MDDQTILRAITVAAAVIALIAAAATARGAARAANPWSIGAYIVALAMVGVGYELASRSALYWSY